MGYIGLSYIIVTLSFYFHHYLYFYNKYVISDIIPRNKSRNIYYLDFANPLIKVQSNYSHPVITDCIAHQSDNGLEVVAIVNYEILPLNTIYKKHVNYSLIWGNEIYANPVPDHNHHQRVQVINYTIPTSVKLEKMDIHIIDNRYGIEYTFNISVLHKSKIKRNVVSCAYISDYNTVNEVKSWVVYNKMIGVDMVIIYSVMELPSIKQSIQKLIDEGFVRWYSFLWPLRNYRGFYQRSLQFSQINSCYYRHRHEFNHIILVDVDEYLLSYEFPYNIYSSILSHFDKDSNALVIPSHLYSSVKTLEREEELKNGTIFDNYNCWLDNEKSRRSKLILSSSTTGFIGNHECHHCKMSYLNTSDLHIFHLRSGIPPDIKKWIKNIPKYCNASHSYLSSTFRYYLKQY